MTKDCEGWEWENEPKCWWDKPIRSVFNGWSGGTGEYIAEAGENLMKYIRYADDRNLEKIANGLNRKPKELEDLFAWAYDSVPQVLLRWVGALLLVGVEPKVKS